MEANNDVNIIIHVGPGKSGSTAIQNWLNNPINNDELLTKGIYYPQHQQDENGVSSGNVYSIFDLSKDRKQVFNRDKAKDLIKFAQKKGVNTLVLSSEVFIIHIEELILEFPNATFVYYLRSPIEYIESLYNQSVKRHFQRNPFAHANRSSFKHPERLATVIKNNPDLNLIVRLYGKQFFTGSDIVQDFLSLLPGRFTADARSKRINWSYSLEALEFKRGFNHIESVEMHRKLDLFLQTYNGATTNYSLMSQKTFNDYKFETLSQLRKLFKVLTIDSDSYLKYVRNFEHKPHVQQAISKDALNTILDDIYQKDIDLFNTLAKELSRYMGKQNLSESYILDWAAERLLQNRNKLGELNLVGRLKWTAKRIKGRLLK